MDPDKETPDSPEIPSDEELSRAEEGENDGVLDDVKEPEDTALNSQEILEKNLGIVKFYDYVVNNALNIIFQPKLITKYKKDLVVPLLGSEDMEPEKADRGRSFLRDEYYDLHIMEKTQTVIENAEQVAKSHGIRSPLQRRFSIWQLIISTVSIGAYFLLATLFSSYGTYFLIGSFVLMCFGSQGMRIFLQKQWDKFQKAHEAEIIEHSYSEIQDIKQFVQDVLDDTRERLLNQSLPLERFQFILFSNDYQNVVFVKNQVGQQGGPIKAIYQFQYPEGMGGMAPASYGDTSVSKDIEHDEFILLQKAAFSDDGALTEFSVKTADDDTAHLVELLLNNSEFRSVDSPEVVIPTFNELQTEIQCSCGDFIQMDSMKTCISPLHNNFEFYMIVGKKCTCGKNPFMIINSPGNRSIPEGLRKIFEGN